MGCGRAPSILGHSRSSRVLGDGGSRPTRTGAKRSLPRAPRGACRPPNPPARAPPSPSRKRCRLPPAPAPWCHTVRACASAGSFVVGAFLAGTTGGNHHHHHRGVSHGRAAPWGGGGQVVEGGKDAGYGLVILGGVVLLGAAAYQLFSAGFAPSSPQHVYSKASDLLRRDPEVQKLLGPNIKTYGEETSRRRRGLQSTKYFNAATQRDHVRVLFSAEGDVNAADVIADVTASGQFYLLTVEVPVTGTPPPLLLLHHAPTTTADAPALRTRVESQERSWCTPTPGSSSAADGWGRPTNTTSGRRERERSEEPMQGGGAMLHVHRRLSLSPPESEPREETRDI